MTTDDEYFRYLATRSRLGWLYRRWWLYPRLCRYLTGRVLDVGCGMGDMLAFRPATIGVDINARTVAWCQSMGLDARLMQPDVLPFPSNSFDGIVLDNVLEHLVDPAPLLGEIRRVLVPSGRVVIGVPGRRGFQCDPDHKVFYDESSLRTLLARFTFFPFRMFYMPLYWPLLDKRLSQYCLYGVFDLYDSGDRIVG